MAQGFFKNIIRVVRTSTFNTIVRAITGILIARVLGPDGRGLLTSLLVVPTMVISLGELGVRRASIIQIGEKKFSHDRIISVLSFFFLFTSIVGIIITAIVYNSYDKDIYAPVLIALALLSIPIRLISKFSNSIIVAHEQFKISNIIRSTSVILNFLFLIVFIVLIQYDVLGALIALVASNFISAMYALRIILKKYPIRISFDLEVIKSLLSLGIVYAVALFLARLNFKIDILILNHLSTIDQVGFYSLGSSFAEKWQAPFAVGAVILSSSANRSDQDAVNSDVARLFRISLFFALIVSSLVYFLAPYLIPFLYKPVFIPSIPVVQFILPAIVTLVLSKILASRIASLKKTYLIIFVHIPALIVNIILNYLFIPEHGAMGAVYATLISYSLSFTLLLFVYWKVTGTTIWQLFAFKVSDFKFRKKTKV